MSYWDDRDFDPYADDGEDEHCSREVTCERCGAKGLVWSEVKIKVFRLYDPQLGRLHTCPPALDFK